ncbi:long-chain-fatty-acid--CoA ligase [Candidatus Marinamargulisbacteria bacterium SCGC AAA071-K20]|nr:long-chain-fatty-acid--CoA ligase [Candidatus Marinamargulisbacteria bacterium SCGC AAA071-K20]
MINTWLKEYPEGVPPTIDTSSYESLNDMFTKSFKQFSNLPAYTNMRKTLTFGEIDILSSQFASFLQHQLGLKKGDRVAIMMPNLLQYPICLYGILKAGCIVVNVNPLYTAHELEHQLKDSGAKAIIILENFAHVLCQAISKTELKHVVTTQIGDCFPFVKRNLINFIIKFVKKMVPKWSLPGSCCFNNALLKGMTKAYIPSHINKDDIAFLQYTGGTTGVSKGAVLSHGNILANLLQITAWIGPFVEEGKEQVLTPLPLYHIFSLSANLLTFCVLGGELILITNPRDIPKFVKKMKYIPFTILTGVNTLFNALSNSTKFKDIDFSRLKFTIGGGMAVQEEVAKNWQDMTHSPLIEGYGLTESSPVAAVNPVNMKAYNGAIGLPLPSTELSIRDDDGKELSVGDEGEIWIKGPQVMKGYWKRDEETKEVLTSDGWLKTGDIGKVDDKGYFFVVDRKKDMILVSGFNVYPNEIEEIAVKHPDILEAAAIGIPHAHSGEVVKLICVRNNNTVTERELIDHCREYLTKYKIPRTVEFVDELPKTNVGKILRRALRDKK